MPSSRFWILIGTVFGLLLLGMMTLRGGLIALAIPLLVYLGVAVLNAPSKARLEVERAIRSPVAKQHSPVQVDVLMKNEEPAVDEFYIEDELPPQLQMIEGRTKILKTLAAGETAEYGYTLRFVRGKHTLKQLDVQLSEHFGLLVSHFSLPLFSEFHSLPEAPRLKRINIRPGQTRGFSGPIPARQSGAGMIFWGVREYHLGDYLRRINWKVSSRYLQNLFTNEYEQERIADVGLILDARDQTNIKAGEQSIFEYSVQAAAALAESFLADGHRLSLLAYGFGLQRIYPGYGKVQHERILHALAQVETGSNYALEDFNYLPTRLFPARSQLVVISPLGPRDFLAFVRLIKAGYEVMLVSPDPVSFEARLYPETVEIMQAIRLARLERSLILRKLTRLGVQVVNWQVEQPFDVAMRAATGRRPLFRTNLRMIPP